MTTMPKWTRPARSAAVAVLLIGLTLWSVGTGLMTSGFTSSDASRHAMDGVLLHDLAAGGHFRDAYRYVVDYYGRYPALAIGYYPPFFAAVEAVVFSILPLARESALATELLFALVALLFWYMLVRSTHDRKHAVLASVFLMVNPLTVLWAREIMLEMPALALVIVTMFFLERFSRAGRIADAYGLAAGIGLAFLTKQTAIFVVPVALVTLAVRGKIRSLARWAMLGPAALAALLLAPWLALTIALGGVNIHQSVGSLGETLGAPARWSFAAWSYYLLHVSEVVTLPVAVLAAGAAIIRPRNVGLYLVWLGVFYIFASVVSVKEPRYFYLGVPPICLLAAVGAVALFRWQPRRWGRVTRAFAYLVVGCALIWPVWQTARLKVPRIDGYDAAAHRMADLRGVGRILVGTYDDGAMVFYLRLHDPAQRLQVFRVSKLFYSTAIMEQYGFQEFVRTYDDMKNLLKEYGIRYVLVERPVERNAYRKGSRLQRLLDDHLNSADFRPVSTVPVWTNLRSRPCSRLAAYEFVEAGPPRRQSIDIQILAIGKTLRVPLRRDD